MHFLFITKPSNLLQSTAQQQRRTIQAKMSILELIGPGYTPAGMDPTGMQQVFSAPIYLDANFNLEFFVNGDEPYVLASDYTILPQPTQQHLVMPQLAGTIEGTADLLSLSSGAHVPETLPETSTAPAYQPHGSPASTSSGSSRRRKGRLPTPVELDGGEEDSQVVIKRQRNTMAARKYRQKRLDRISDLERSLGDMTDQRDALKLQLARKEAEVDALREMLTRK